MKNRSIGFVSLIILAIVISTLIPTKQAEPEAPVKFRPMVSIQISFPIPNVEYCYMCSENKAKAKVVIDSCLGIKEQIDELEFPTVDVILTSLGTYYVTGYTSWELNGSVQTASGAICHKADSIKDSFYNPTTCAADVWGGYHEFGDILFLEDFGYFIVEDTGSAVLGKHIDLYYGLTYEDNQEALTITGYYEVYSVEYEYGTAKARDYDVRPLVWEAQNE